jgi:hypothetical protein
MKSISDLVSFVPHKKLRSELEHVEEFDTNDIPTGFLIDYLELAHIQFSFVRYFVDWKNKTLLT